MPINATGKQEIYKLHKFLYQDTVTLRKMLLRVFPVQIISQIPIMNQYTNLERASLPNVPTDVQGRRSGRVPRLHPFSSRLVLKLSSSTLLRSPTHALPCGVEG